jgi:serine protease
MALSGFPTLAPAASRPTDADTDQFIIRFKDATAEHNSANARQRMLDGVGHRQGLRLGQQRRLGIGADVVRSDRRLDPAETKALLMQLRNDPRVEFAQVDARMQPLAIPNDPLYSYQWPLFDAVGLDVPGAWGVTTGAGQVVAVIDTGVTAHSDLVGWLVAGYDFITDPAAAGDGDGRDAVPNDAGDGTHSGECPGSPAAPSSWHGTQVAGLVAATGNNGNGIVGVAHGARVMPLRVLGKCGGVTSDIVDALVWAAGGSVPGLPVNANPAKVIALALGSSTSCDPAMQTAIDASVAAGAAVIVGGGNDNAEAAGHSPASCAHVIAIAALDGYGRRARYSNYGSAIDLAAPGGDNVAGVFAPSDAGTYGPYYETVKQDAQGTSVAAAHVAGVAALMQAAAGGAPLTPVQLESLLEATTRALPVPCPEGCGAGLVDARTAVLAATQPILVISAPADVAEGDSGTHELVFTVSLSRAVGSAVTFDIATVDGTALAGSDYVARALAGQVIPAGATSVAFAVTVNGDAAGEADETFRVRIGNVAGGGVVVVDTEGEATVLNDDQVLLANGVPHSGLSSPLNWGVRVQMAVPVGATNLRFETSGGFGDADLYVRHGDLPTTSVHDCRSIGPTTAETCAFATPSAGVYFVLVYGYSAFSHVSLTGSYALPNSLSINDASVAEGPAGTRVVTFTVALAQPQGGDVTYDLATANGTALAGSDFVARSLTGLTIPAGQLSRAFAVTVNGDDVAEANETFVVNLGNVSGVAAGDTQGTATILNDDGPTMWISDVSHAEGNDGGSAVTVTVTLSQASPVPVTYVAVSADGTAVAGSDFGGLYYRYGRINAGELSDDFTVYFTGDTTVEADETFFVDLGSVRGATALKGRARLTLVNDDIATLAIDDAKIVEGNSGNRLLDFTVRLAGAAVEVPVAYDIATMNASATAGVDYMAKALAGETMPPGQRTRGFQVAINGDTTVEGNEVFQVNLANVSGALVQDGQASGLILNDDGPTLSIGDIAVAEGNTGTRTGTFTVRLSQAAAVPVSYDIATANGPAATGAQAGPDFVARALAGETIPAGMLSKTFAVTVNGDTTSEPNEVLRANLGNAVGATIQDAQADLYVVNDDGPTLSIADAAISEGNSGTKQVVFTIALSQAATVPVFVNLATGNGSALAGSDYVAATATGLMIPAGMLSKTFAVTVNGDTSVEANEQFTLTITGASGATIADAGALGIITNDD